jgi:hypothetical protein
MFRNFWKKYGFEICLGLALLALFLIWVYRKLTGKKGTYSTSFNLSSKGNKPKRKPPSESKGELECRRVLEKMFGKSFPKIRPNMLRNPVTSSELNDNNLELDCYNDELKLAVEYNGIQHYKYIPFFHKNKEAFQNQKYRDHMKRELCQKNGITLIEVPYTVKVPDIEKYLKDNIKN